MALNHLTVGEALFYSAHLRGMKRRDAIDERNRLLKIWEMEEPCGTFTAVRACPVAQRRLLRLAVATAVFIQMCSFWMSRRMISTHRSGV